MYTPEALIDSWQTGPLAGWCPEGRTRPASSQEQSRPETPESE